MLPQEERQQLLYEWNATEVEYPRDKCVHELFEEQVEKTPNTIAIAYQEQALSYGELNRRANQLAHYLRELGVRPDERVAICAERSLEMVVGLLAVLKAGGAYVPLDPAYPVERLRFMLEDSAPVALLTQTRLKNPFIKSDDGRPIVMLDGEGAGWMTLYGDRNPRFDETRFDEIGVTAQNLACIIYTSGSTGTSKGVAVQHGGIVNLVHDWTTRFGNRVRRDALQASLWTSFGFDVSIFELFAGFCLSATVNIVPEQIRGDSRALFAWFVAHGIAFGYLPPFFIRDAQHADAPISPLPLELVLVGVEPSTESALYQLQSNTPRLHVVNGYGPAETTVFSTTYTEIGNRFRNTPIGRPLANTRIYILDAHGEPVPVGVTGELYIGGAGVARGYLNRPELTAERFVRDPFTAEAGARMYRTGDLGRWLADGNIEFLGRNDFQVKIRGFRIELGEIEARLSEHEGVQEAVVLAREDTPGDKRLVAYYTAREQNSVGAQELRAHVAAKLPEYMVPAAYVKLESLPLTPNGKLNRKALPAPEGDAYVVRQYEAPQGTIEELLAGIWAKLLNLERVGRHDNFFELGGHSLMAVTLVERLAQAGLKADVRALFTTPTLAKLAASFDTNAPALETPRQPHSIPSRNYFFFAHRGIEHMSIGELLAALGAKGIQLRRNGDELLIRGNSEALDPALISAMREAKPLLLKHVSRQQDEWWTPSFTILPEMLPLVQLKAEEIERVVSQVPGGASNVQDIYPLTPFQEGILFHHLKDEGAIRMWLLARRPSIVERAWMRTCEQCKQWWTGTIFCGRQ